MRDRNRWQEDHLAINLEDIGLNQKEIIDLIC
jgi:hypothetical protein